MQYAAQHKAYSQYSDAAFFVVLHEQQPIGRIYLQYRETALLIVDLSLMPEWRGQGIGTHILEAAFCHAEESRRPAVQIHVEKFNPARRLYQRLGFQQIEDKGVYLFLERSLPGTTTTESGTTT
jgi:GNAT superfamily N-acetyltransferase